MEDNINKDNTSNNGDTMVLNQDSIRRMKMRDAKRKYRAQLSEKKKEEIREKDAAAKRNKKLLNQHVGNITDGNVVLTSIITMEDNINKDNTSNNGDTMVLNQDSIRRMKVRDAKRKYRAQLSEKKEKEIREKEAGAKRNKKLLNQHIGNITDGNEVKCDPFYTDGNDVIRDPFYIDGMKSDTHVEICLDLEIEESIQQRQKAINRTVLTCDELGYNSTVQCHQALVCVVCDCFISGVQENHWITTTALLFHSNILSSKYHYGGGMNIILKSQYTVSTPELAQLLLSPRARFNRVKNEYSCCETCFSILSECKIKKHPPKYAISNGVPIGVLPSHLLKDITPAINNLVAPVRAFNYFLSFMGGKEKKIIGNFTFFAQDISQNAGALQHAFRTNHFNPCLFVILLGSFTIGQLNKIKRQGTFNVETFLAVYKFLSENNPYYSELPSVDNVPILRVEQVQLQDDEDEDNANSDEKVGAASEDEITWKYWFPSNGDPNSHSGTCKNQSEFASALFSGETPTLFFHPSQMVTHAKLSQICPLAFPFGSGDVGCKRRPAVTEIECLRHYLQLSLPQFQDP